MTARVTPRAARHIRSIGRHIARDRPLAAAGVETAIRNTIAIAAEHPGSGSATAIPGVRRLVSAHGYLIYYLTDEGTDEVVVAAVLHPKRRQPFQR